ncbi:hypothetical protein M3P05_07495 [Sansalvadorimonas sp. 2012CJ34-2]|uniref:Uncharacterized protein n=1 Tax=Parendozoicomonas callyspongiae TaxID=2942213 RepID=A0ABT0PG85_9GAMM|nr:hypothetical protein [Sansalvadorimonas sp. 2012CJ34-2]MCL6269782.1 hypothetical protein [Sansalvadorimonas sp. 2012CJ34-2]
MEVLSIFNGGIQGFNSLADSITRPITGSVTPVKPTNSLCRHSSPDPQFYSLSRSMTLPERSVSNRPPVGETDENKETTDSFVSATSSVSTSISSDNDELPFESLTSTVSEDSYKSIPEDDEDGDEDEFFGWNSKGEIETNPVEETDDDYKDSETFNPEVASSLRGLFQTALNTLQTIFNKLGGQPPELLLHGLHQHSILVAQFRQEKEETIALLEARIKALREDIGKTFSRFSSRKTQALKDMEQLQRQLDQLKKQKDEESLNALLDGILAYETEFEKVSWVLLSSLAFLNMAEQKDQQLTASMKKVIPAQLLEAGTASMLNPGQVHKYGRGYTGSRHIQEELITLVQKRIETIGAEDALQKVAGIVDQLDTTVLGTPEQVRDPKQAFMQVIETQPALASRILSTYFQICDFDANQETKAGGQTIRTILDAIPEEDASEYLKASLATFDGTLDPALTEMGKWVQKHYLRQQNQQLKEQTATLLKEEVVIPQQQYEEMTQQVEQLRTLAAALNYNTNPIKSTALEMRKLSAQKVIRAMATGEPLWHLGSKLHADPETNLQQVTDAIHGKDKHPYAEAVRKLHAYTLHNDNGRAQGLNKGLRKKDELMCCQRDIYMDKAREHFGDQQQFVHHAFMAQSIEALRPKPMLMNMFEGTASPMDVAKRLGRGAMTPGALPFVHQMKELKLMHDLTLRGYKFEDEAWDLLNYLPSVGSHLWTAGGQTYTDGKALVGKLANMELGPVEAAREVVKLGTETTDRLTKDFQEILTGAALLGKTNPRLLRALNGNLRQTLTVLGNTVGTNSTLYNWFNELHSRVSAEAWTQCVIDNLDNEPVDLSKIPEDQLKAVKRLVTLNRLLTCGPYVPHVLNAALGTIQSAGNPVSTAWTWAKAAANIFYSRLVQTKVNAMEGRDVQALNTLMDTLTEGPAYATWRQQMMEQSGQLIADIACKRPIKAALASTGILGGLLGEFSIMGVKPFAWLGNISPHPYKAMVKRVNGAFSNWWHGKPGGRTELAIRILQCAPIALPAASLIPALLAPGILGLIGTVTLVTPLLVATHFIIKEIARFAGMTDVAVVVASHVHNYLNRPDLNVKQGVEKLLKATDYENHIQYVAENHAFAAIANGYWDQWAKSCKDEGEKAKQAEAKIYETVEKDFASNPGQFNRLKQVKKALDYLKGHLDSGTPELVDDAELKKILPAEDVPDLPENHHRLYWSQVMIQRLHDEMFSAIGFDEKGEDSIPQTEEELEQRLKKFTADRLCGAMLVSEYAPARGNLVRAREHYTKLLMDRVQELTEVDIMKAVEHAMTAVRLNRIKQHASCKNDKINPDDFEQAVNNDEGFEQEMRRYINDVVMAQYRAAFAFVLERMKRQLREQRIPDSMIRELIAQL